MAKVEKEYKHWEAEKRLIPTMVRIYCKGNHKAKRKEEGIKGKDVCSDCKELTEFAEYRLEKCPFKKNKGFCSFCTQRIFVRVAGRDITIRSCRRSDTIMRKSKLRRLVRKKAIAERNAAVAKIA